MMLWGYDLAHILIVIVILAGVVAIVYVALNQFGIGIPDWVKKVFWIVVVVFVCVFAIKVLMAML